MGLFEHWILQNPFVNHPYPTLDWITAISYQFQTCLAGSMTFPAINLHWFFWDIFPYDFPYFPKNLPYLPIVSDIFPVGFSYFPQKPPHVFPLFFRYFPHISYIFPYFSHLSLGFPSDKAMLHRSPRSACRARSASSSSPACSGARVITPRPLEAIQRTYVGEQTIAGGTTMGIEWNWKNSG